MIVYLTEALPAGTRGALALGTRDYLEQGYNLLSMVAAGLGDVDDCLPILERRERERQLERERLARKKAAAAKTRA